MESVGWLVAQDEDTIKIATTLDRLDSLGENEGEPTYYGIVAFPSGCVLSCVPLHTLINLHLPSLRTVPPMYTSLMG